MQSRTLHIASSLFSIFNKVLKFIDQIWLSHRGSFVKNGE